jgi:hypothetical protein
MEWRERFWFIRVGEIAVGCLGTVMMTAARSVSVEVRTHHQLTVTIVDCPKLSKKPSKLKLETSKHPSI